MLVENDDFEKFWGDLLADSSRDVLFIVGLGIDPRMCLASEKILALGGAGKRKCLAIDYSGGLGKPLEEKARGNRENLERLFSQQDGLQLGRIEKRSPEGRRIASEGASRLLTGEIFKGYSDVIIDVSALPRDIFLTLIAKSLFLIDHSEGGVKVNLHVVVAESPRIDREIKVGSLDEDITFIKAFSGQYDLEATADVPRIWIPILGEGRDTHLRRIFDALRPDEINPLIPWPAENPRRGDELVQQYRELLFDVFRIEARGIIYAAEQNPFQVYREIVRAVLRYHEALGVLGGCKAFVSPLSSKLLSVGALLACYELRFERGVAVGIPHLTGERHQLDEVDLEAVGSRLYSLWLAGDCYED